MSHTLGAVEGRAEAQASHSDESRPPRERWGPRALRTTVLIFLASCSVMTYHFLYQVTKPSPLLRATWVERVPALAYGVLVALLVTLIGVPLAIVVDRVTRRYCRDPRLAAGTVLVSGLIWISGFLAFLENFAYSLSNVGLKTEDGSVVAKLVFGVIAVSAGLLTARSLATMKPRTVRFGAWVIVGLTVPSLVVAGLYLQRQEDPAPLVADPAGGELLNVVILSSDGIDSEHMSVYGYARGTTPFLDSKRDELRVFNNAFTNNGNTTGSIASLLTGRSPSQTGVVYPPDALDEHSAKLSLPYLLGRLGYRRSNWAVPYYADAHDQNLVDAFDEDNGYEPASSPVTYLPLGAGSARWFVTETLESTGELLADVVGADEMANPFAAVGGVAGDVLGDEGRLTGVKRAIGGEAPFFVNTHFLVSHGPYFSFAQSRWSTGEEQDEAWMDDFYDDSILEFDEYVEDVYAELERTGRLDDTVIIVTSDHGEDYDASKRVPLLIRLPGGEGAGSWDVNVQRLDVAPTLLELLGYEKPEWMPGTSLADPDSIPADREFTAANTATRAFTNHHGVRPADGALTLTAVRCRSWVRVTPDGHVERGTVAGTTATCDAKPTPPTQGSIP